MSTALRAWGAESIPVARGAGVLAKCTDEVAATCPEGQVGRYFFFLASVPKLAISSLMCCSDFGSVARL